MVVNNADWLLTECSQCGIRSLMVVLDADWLLTECSTDAVPASQLFTWTLVTRECTSVKPPARRVSPSSQPQPSSRYRLVSLAINRTKVDYYQ